MNAGRSLIGKTVGLSWERENNGGITQYTSGTKETKPATLRARDGIMGVISP